MPEPRLSRGKTIQLDRLLNMMYRPSEIAAELGVTPETFTRSYIPAGAPVTLDGAGKMWINGRAFADWARAYLTTKRNKRKLEMPDGHAYCLKCNQVIEVLQGRRRPYQRGVVQLSGRCSLCGGKVNRFLKPGKELA